MQLNDNHSSLKYEPLVHNICRELFSKTPVSFFNFGRFYKNGYVLNLSSKNKWHRHFWDKNYITLVHERLEEGVNYWLSHDEMSHAATDAEENFGIYGRIEIVEGHQHYIDIFGYGCSKENKDIIINYYLNNMSQLKNFNLHFLSEMSPIIAKIEKNEDFLPLPFYPSTRKQKHIDLNLVNQSKKVVFTHHETDIVFTSYQFKVLAFKLRGYSIAEIANCLNNSEETVKTHLKNIKKKIHLQKHEGFIEKCIEIGIYDLSESTYKSCLRQYLKRVKSLR
ncbi:helix-turn-helix transcriptional regulator [Fangia hongkongensis]|uniref:helix-turn-helix transcriptional regulator n=2 Tax=Fangia hongkongensis TaxID=270495 RepID=UPI00036658FA|nr:LuxR C-terminal-related transcriptional regulator [Fangia hongkongensis]